MGNQDPHPQDTGARRLTATKWPAVWAVFFAGLAAAGCIGKVPPLLPTLRGDLGLTLVQSGFIATMLNVMGMTVGLFAGMLADRFGHKRFVLAGLALLALGGCAGAAALSYPMLLASRFLEGTGFVMTTLSGIALITNATLPGDRPTAMSMWSAYMPTGGAVSMLLAPLALVAIGWRGYWIVVALAAALAFLLVARLVPAPAFGGHVRIIPLALESLGRRGSLLLCLAFFGYAAQWASIMVWLPTFAIDERGASATLAALLTTGMVAINIPGNLAGGWVMGRGFSRANLIVFAGTVQAVAGVGVFLDILPDALRYACCLAFSLFGGLLPMAVLSGVPVHARSNAHIGTANGMVMQVSHFAQFFGPLTVAWLAVRYGWTASLVPMLAFAACSIVAGFAIGRLERGQPG
ncbi:MAG: MFS transporter [Betaproteobacteria bacterium]|nr:MFS transporter [Betaproteobacteria bacterium]